jgi:hypothetical protein
MSGLLYSDSNLRYYFKSRSASLILFAGNFLYKIILNNMKSHNFRNLVFVYPAYAGPGYEASETLQILVGRGSCTKADKSLPLVY